VQAGTAVGNLAMRRVLERLGFAETKVPDRSCDTLDVS
jgi:RimJ/RimL family protein N-acetyltransferase